MFLKACDHQAICTRMGGIYVSLRWRHNDHDSVSNHQPHGCLLSRLFGRRSKKHQSSASLAFVRGIHRDRGIPRTKGQLRGKCFHLMTSSCRGLFHLVKLGHGLEITAYIFAWYDYLSMLWYFVLGWKNCVLWPLSLTQIRQGSTLRAVRSSNPT